MCFLQACQSPVQACAWSPSSSQLLVALALSLQSSTAMLLVLSTALDPIMELQAPGPVVALAWSPCCSVLAYISCTSLRYHVLPGQAASSRAAVELLTALQVSSGAQDVYAVSWSLHGTCLLVGRYQHLARSLHARQGGLLRIPEGLACSDSIQLPSLSPDGSAVLHFTRVPAGGPSVFVTQLWARQEQDPATQLCPHDGSHGVTICSRSLQICNHESRFIWHPSGLLFAVVGPPHSLQEVSIYTHHGSLLQLFELDSDLLRVLLLIVRPVTFLSFSAMGDEVRFVKHGDEMIVLPLVPSQGNCYRQASKLLVWAPVSAVTVWQICEAACRVTLLCGIKDTAWQCAILAAWIVLTGFVMLQIWLDRQFTDESRV